MCGVRYGNFINILSTVIRFNSQKIMDKKRRRRRRKRSYYFIHTLLFIKLMLHSILSVDFVRFKQITTSQMKNELNISFFHIKKKKKIILNEKKEKKIFDRKYLIKMLFANKATTICLNAIVFSVYIAIYKHLFLILFQFVVT